MRPLRLAIVDDSLFVRKALQRIFESEPLINVVGTATTGEELVTNLGSWRPEVITLDLNMPGMGGLETLERVLKWKHIPVIILSTHSSKDAPLTIEALHRGAVDFIDKQKYSLVDFESLRQVLLEKILQVTGVGAHPAAPPGPAPAKPPPPAPSPRALRAARSPFNLVLIGSSTGGPPAIQLILEQLTFPFPMPVVVIQHMPPGFIGAFAARLDSHLPLSVCEATNGQRLVPGSVYLAPGGSHLLLDLEKEQLVAVKSRFPANVLHQPSIDVCFRSAAKLNGRGIHCLAALLTGMGDDGAAGLLELAQAGAYTIGQDEASCVVYGMPKVAKELGAVSEELRLNCIAARINDLVRPDSSSGSVATRETS